MTTLKVEPAQSGWGLWLEWIGGSVLGLGVGLLVGGPIIGFGALFAALAGRVSGGVIGAVMGGVGGTILGIVAGVMQGSVVCRYVVGPWVRASMAGYALSLALLTSLSGLSSGGLALCFDCYAPPGLPAIIDLRSIPAIMLWSVGGIVIGTVVGILQWLVLRRHVSRAGWWVFASATGSAAAALISYSLNISFPSLSDSSYAWISSFFLIPIVFGAIGGVGYAIITGAALVWLLRQTRSGIQTGTIDAHALKGTL